MSFIALFDRNFHALGTWTQHVAKTWSLKRKAYEFDEFEAECRGYENSSKAYFVILYSEDGKPQYVCLSGIPSTSQSSSLTTISGLDARQIFNNEVVVDYSQLESDGSYKIKSVSSLFNYLLKDVFADILDLGFSYDIDTSEADEIEWNEDLIARTKDIRNVWSQLQAVCSFYDCFIEASLNVDQGSNNFRISFNVRRLTQLIAIRLADYEVQMTSDSSSTNEVLCYSSDYSSSKHYYLTNNNQIVTEQPEDALRSYPPRVKTFVEDTLEEAVSKGLEELENSKYKDKVSIDLNTKQGSFLKLENPFDIASDDGDQKGINFRYFVDVTGYYPADSSTVKRLPVSAISIDDSGKSSIELGRLSDYFFLED